MMASAGVLALGVVIGIGLVLPSFHPQKDVTAGCQEDFIVPALWVCGAKVYMKHGQQMQYAGRTSDLHAMPRAREERSR